MANLVKHRFASGKTDGPDASQVQPSHWNDGHAFSGGAAGDVLTRDPTDATYGAKWVTPVAPVTTVTTITHAGSGSTDAPYVVIPTGAGMIIDVDCSNLTTISIHGLSVPADLKFGTRVTIRARSTGDVLLIPSSASAPSNGAFLNWFVSGPTPLAAGNGLDGSYAGGAGGTAAYVFDGARWRLVQHEQGKPLAVPYNPANFGGFTISAGTVTAHGYLIHGTDAHILIALVSAVIATATPAPTIGGFPFAFASGSQSIPIPCVTSLGGYGFCFMRPTADLSAIKVETTTFANWAPGSYDWMGSFTAPIR